ncbi:hypothetical protein B7463_g4891, partial [Scytalidium lignicola]
MLGYRAKGDLMRLVLAALAAFSLIVWIYQRHVLSLDDLLAHTANNTSILIHPQSQSHLTNTGASTAATSIASKTIENSRTSSTLLTPSTATGLQSSTAHGASGIDGPILESSTDSSTSQSKVWSRIGKISSLYYDEVTSKSQAYERALLSHIEHDQRFSYSHFVLRRGIVEGLWTKHALVLHHLVQELAKPQAERLDWLFWHDADVVIVNNQMPLEAFLPPEPQWSHINFMVSNDLGGLNDGVFYIRVCEWSVHFFAAGLSYPVYKPDVPLRYDEQTALEFLIQDERWANNTMHVPQRWFNAYHHFGSDDDIPPEWNWSNGYQEPGDLLVHLPGTGDFRSQLIDEWLHKVRFDPDTYSMPLSNTTYPDDIKAFWENEAKSEAESQETFWRRWKLIQEVGRDEDDKTRKQVEETEARMKGESKTDQDIEKAVNEIKGKRKQGKIEALRAADKDAASSKTGEEKKDAR